MGIDGMQRFFLVKSGQHLVSRAKPIPHLMVENQLIGQKWLMIALLPQDIDAGLFCPSCKNILPVAA